MSLGSVRRQAYQRRMQRPAGSNFELWSWYFFRVSGVLLLFLAIVHGQNGLRILIDVSFPFSAGS